MIHYTRDGSAVLAVLEISSTARYIDAISTDLSLNHVTCQDVILLYKIRSSPSSPSIMPESPYLLKVVALDKYCHLDTPSSTQERVSREGCQCAGCGSSGSSAHAHSLKDRPSYIKNGKT
jgi:hypothetical protein